MKKVFIFSRQMEDFLVVVNVLTGITIVLIAEHKIVIHRIISINQML